MNTSSTPRAHNSRHRIARTRRAITVDMLLSETSQSQWISNTGPTPCRWDGTSGRKRHETGEADSCIPPPMPRVASGHRRVGASIGCVSIVAEHALERRLEWQVDALHREAEKLLLVDHAVLRLVKLVEEGVGGGGVGERARDVVHVALQLVAHLLGLLHEESAHLHRVEVAAAVFVELFPHVLRHVVRHTRREVLEALLHHMLCRGGSGEEVGHRARRGVGVGAQHVGGARHARARPLGAWHVVHRHVLHAAPRARDELVLPDAAVASDVESLEERLRGVWV
mmetsp:Transcript_66724/g.183033  ORF Transcript_66724/g.183033 Transcript_66724/m.183033 type:complete len:283 (+) Transcript_66724:96-944(+)